MIETSAMKTMFSSLIWSVFDFMIVISVVFLFHFDKELLYFFKVLSANAIFSNSGSICAFDLRSSFQIVLRYDQTPSSSIPSKMNRISLQKFNELFCSKNCLWTPPALLQGKIVDQLFAFLSKCYFCLV